MSNQMPNFFLTTLAQSLSAGGSETEVFVSSITTLDGTVIQTSDFSEWGRGVLTIDPQSTARTEFVSFTAVDSSGIGFSGATRGLSFNSNTSVSGNKHFHPVGAQVIISWGSHNILDMISVFAAIASPETITGLWNFTTLPTLGSDPITSSQVATKHYVDIVAVAGAPNASTTVKGIVQEATLAQLIARTALGSTGAELYVNPATLPSVLVSDYKVDTGSANAYAIAPSPAIVAYTVGQVFTFKAANSNSGASTLNVNGLGAKNILKLNGATALASGDIASGQVVVVEYDGTEFQLLSPVANAPLTAAYTTNVQTFLTSGTYTMSANAQKVLIQAWGGGGSGQACRRGGVGDVFGGGGGGGGEFVEVWLNASDITSPVTVTVSTGGAAVTQSVQGGTAGNVGGNSTFGAYVTAHGGAAGPTVDVTTGGTPAGGAGGSTFAIAGFYGTDGTPRNGFYSGAGGNDSVAGGNSVYGGAGGGGSAVTAGTSSYGGNGGAGTSVAGTTTASTGVVPGGGGGAAYNTSNAGTATSGAGATGKIIVTTFF